MMRDCAEMYTMNWARNAPYMRLTCSINDCAESMTNANPAVF